MNILTVSQLNIYLRELLDADEIVRDIWIEGEISNFVRASSGHCYFTLKEGECLGACGDAPVLLHNNKRMLCAMTPDKLDQMLEELK